MPGAAMVGFDGHRGWVYHLAVEPALRRSGCGKAMLRAAKQWLRARNTPKLMLMVAEASAATLDFYRALGFAQAPVIMMGKRLD